MYEYCKTWLELKTDKRAVTALEYGLIAGVLVAVIIAGFGILGNNLSSKFQKVANQLT